LTTSIPLFQKFIRITTKFFKDPFGTIDSIDLQFRGFQINILRNDEKLCKVLLELFVLIPLIFWVLLGADSTIDQIAWPLYNIPNLIIGRITFDQWVSLYTNYYGIGTHWSASVIYGLLFVGVSKHFREKLGIFNSENLALTTGFVGLAISTFEFFWMISFYYFQKQTWILTLQFPQFRIILQNILFLIPAIIILLGMNRKEYSLNFNRKTLFYLCATIFLVLLWWNYPFPTEQLTVEVVGYGTWTSSSNFIQTMFTIDMDVTDGVAVCEMFFLDNPTAHLVNNLTKICWTLTIYNIAKIKVRDKK